MLEPWKDAWRRGLASQFSDRQLHLLLVALETDDPRLLQRVTIVGYPIEGCCAVAFCGWQGDGLTTSAEVIRRFDDVVSAAVKRLGRHPNDFLVWFDNTDRNQMRVLLAEEIRTVLAERAVQ